MMVTGGAGFIGSNFIHFLFKPETGFKGRVINVDILTYAGNLENLAVIEEKHGAGGSGRYAFERADICDRPSMERIFRYYGVDGVVHFAAESHVDRSIRGPEDFVRTNVMGTFTLLDTARMAWKGREDVLFHHISTDEVYGSLGDEGAFTEATPYDPRSPYSASKAGSDHLVMAYAHTYGLPITITNCSNNYGPYQFPEKLIPLMILNMLEGKPLPVYGDGRNVRDWLYVEDHCAAIWLVMRQAEAGSSYNVGGENEQENIELLRELISIVAQESGKDEKAILDTVTYVKDRPGHDRRYAIDCSKIKDELGWRRGHSFRDGLTETVKWYIANDAWVDRVKSGNYREWVKTNYEER